MMFRIVILAALLFHVCTPEDANDTVVSRKRRYSLPPPDSIDDASVLELLVSPDTLVENETDGVLVRCHVQPDVASVETLSLYVCKSNFHGDRGILQAWRETNEMVVSDRYTQEFGTVAWKLSDDENYVHLREGILPGCDCYCWGCFAQVQVDANSSLLHYKSEVFVRVLKKENERAEAVTVTVTTYLEPIYTTESSKLPTVLTIIMSTLAGLLFVLGTAFLIFRRRKLLRSVTSITYQSPRLQEVPPKHSLFGGMLGRGGTRIGSGKGTELQEVEDALDMRREILEQNKHNRYLVNQPEDELIDQEMDLWRSPPQQDTTPPRQEEDEEAYPDEGAERQRGGRGQGGVATEGEWRRSRLRERLARDTGGLYSHDTRTPSRPTSPRLTRDEGSRSPGRRHRSPSSLRSQ